MSNTLLILEAICPECKTLWYSKALNENCDHFCPDCGTLLKRTGEEFGIIPYPDWQKWRRWVSQKNYREKTRVVV